MSALCQKRTSNGLFDHLVGKLKEGLWDREAECVMTRFKRSPDPTLSQKGPTASERGQYP
jgi:hypothetical protein